METGVEVVFAKDWEKIRDKFLIGFSQAGPKVVQPYELNKNPDPSREPFMILKYKQIKEDGSFECFESEIHPDMPVIIYEENQLPGLFKEVRESRAKIDKA